MDKQEAQQFVLRFLRTMEERDLDSAELMMDDDPLLLFPGGRRFHSQREMVAAAQGRYEWVKKEFQRTDVFDTDAGTVIYVIGTLYGVNRHSVPFQGIRFIDRFLLREGRIKKQEVWNDLAESGVLSRTTASDE